jgi:hypothetical protein
MKKILLIVAITLSTQVSLAASSPVPASMITADFQKNFTNAAEVQWHHAENFTRASFVLDGQYLNAYYSPEGELIAVMRNILSSQLPLNLLLDLKKKHGTMWISELFEVVNGSEHHYYVCLENADEKLVLKAKAHKSWKLFRKMAKA